jgi:hypothetical protein
VASSYYKESGQVCWLYGERTVEHQGVVVYFWVAESVVARKEEERNNDDGLAAFSCGRPPLLFYNKEKG